MKKSYKILFIREDKFGLREFNLRASHIYYFISAIIALFMLILVLFSDRYSEWAFNGKLNGIRDDNKELQSIINSQDRRLEELESELELLINQGDIFRKLVKLPPIDDEIRKLGTGGRDIIKESSHLEYLLPKETNLNKLHQNVNHMHRSINLEKLSYNESIEVAKENPNRYRSYPAILPVKKDDGKLSSGYGYRRDPFDKKYKFHDGDDFSANRGTAIYATGDGLVKKSRYWGTFGNYIEIDHGYGYKTIYAHLSKRKVNLGDKIIRGQKIGEVGNTGKSTASHLHYEIKYRGKNVNPREFYFDIPIVKKNQSL